MPVRTANALLHPGAQINRYKVVRKLAEGGFGVVYHGQREDGKEVAIKEFLPSLIPCRRADDHGLVTISDAHQAERFERGLSAFFREADTLSRIHDDRIIAIWDVFKANGTGYFAMPMEKGYTFQTILRTTGALTTARHVKQGHAIRTRVKTQRWLGDAAARRLFVEAALGVEALHQARVLHLDLKPVNLWLRPDGHVVVLDLGASRWADDEAEVQHLARTPGFAAPEQHGPGRHAILDERTDVYGLAASLRACLDGKSPPPAPNRTPNESLGPLHWSRRNPRLLQVVDRGMALAPQNRYQSVAEFRHALEDIPRLDNSSPWHVDLDESAPDLP